MRYFDFPDTWVCVCVNGLCISCVGKLRYLTIPCWPPCVDRLPLLVLESKSSTGRVDINHGPCHGLVHEEWSHRASQRGPFTFCHGRGVGHRFQDQPCRDYSIGEDSLVKVITHITPQRSLVATVGLPTLDDLPGALVPQFRRTYTCTFRCACRV